MNRAAWWTCALLVLAAPARRLARIYERCELAHDLRALGVHPDNLATWVCIAYHESRFDTAANNPYSGDHGLFQISELYWCGSGKACGLPCAALRDDDIADDLECALQVHEEHTRLQGNGFLAWVVYPQHCAHNTKKYLVDCDLRLKNATAPSQGRSFYDNRPKPLPTYSNQPNIDNLLPPYLTISSIFRGSYGKVLDHNKINGVDWYSYKYDKVDELRLPQFEQPAGDIHARAGSTSVAPPSTTTSTTTYGPPLSPRKYIETNQFRKKIKSFEKTTAVPTTKQAVPFEKYTQNTYIAPTESTTHKSLTTVTTADILPKVKSTTTSYKSQAALTSTIKPVNITNTAYKSPTLTTSYKSRTTTTYRPQTVSTYKYPTYSTSKLATFSTFKFPTFSTSAYKFTTTTKKPVTTPSTTAPTYRTTTPRPSTASTFAFTFPKRSFTFRTPAPTTSTTTTTSRQMSNYQLYTFTSRFGTSRSTTAIPKYTEKSTTRPFTTFTRVPTSATRLQTTRVYTTSTTPAPSTSTTRRSTTERTTRTTQNIFDLYLNPTKAPKLPNYSFSSRGNNKFKLNIFSGGTTTLAPPPRDASKAEKLSSRLENNQVRKQI